MCTNIPPPFTQGDAYLSGIKYDTKTALKDVLPSGRQEPQRLPKASQKCDKYANFCGELLTAPPPAIDTFWSAPSRCKVPAQRRSHLLRTLLYAKLESETLPKDCTAVSESHIALVHIHLG